MKERLELVTDFAELRAGMIVVVNPCSVPRCRRSHRHMLIRFSHDPHYENGGRESTSGAWDVLPARKCRPSWEAVISADTVRRRIVFRVVDDLDQSAESRESTTKPKERVTT